MGLRDLAYRLYERRLAVSLSPDAIPRHVGVMCDGNRRWAKSAGFRDVSSGHRKGADKIFELLDWCREAGVEVVTLWLLSTDNLTRSADELVPLLKIIEDTVQGLVAEHWHVNPVGALDLLPGETVRVLKDAADATAHYPGLLVNVAVGYGGRREIMDMIAPLGPVYQAGTLSGNPLAMRGGLATLPKLAAAGFYEVLNRKAQRLAEGFCAGLEASGVPGRVNIAGSLLTLFFTAEPVRDYAGAKQSDAARFASFFHEMLGRGIFLPPSQFEALFVSAAHSEDDIDRTIAAARQSLRAVISAPAVK